MLNAVKRMRCSHRSGVIFLAMITAIAWPTALTIRHSRFAALTLAKLVASLALHPPSSATEADYAPHHRLRRSLSSRRSLWVSASANYRHPPRLIITPNHRPRGSGQRSWTQGVRSTTEGEIFKGTDGACADPGTQNFPCHGGGWGGRWPGPLPV